MGGGRGEGGIRRVQFNNILAQLPVHRLQEKPLVSERFALNRLSGQEAVLSHHWTVFSRAVENQFGLYYRKPLWFFSRK